MTRRSIESEKNSSTDQMAQHDSKSITKAEEAIVPTLHTRDVNSEEELSEEQLREKVLQRYPLLREKSDTELDLLNRTVRRKIDIRMLPMITLMLAINYLDRSNVTNARVAGMQEDLGMNDVQWSAGISLFYAGYIITQVPGSLLLSATRPRITMPLMMLAWSIPTAMFPLVRNAAGFICCRLVVGLAEGPFLPAVALMTSSWYVKDELPFRMALWHGAQTIANVAGGPLAAGILENMDGIAGMKAWQWFLLIEGIFSIVVALVAYLVLPNWANNTPWLSDEETEMAQFRLVMSAGGKDEAASGITVMDGFRMACKEPFTYLFMILHFFLLTAQSFKDFLPTILQTFGQSKMITYLLQSPAYFAGYLAILGFGYLGGRFKDATWFIIGPLCLSIAGTVMLITTEQVAVRYTGVCFLIMGVFSGLNLQVSWETQVVPSPRHKKAALIAMANAVGTVSRWMTPYAFLTYQEPLYQTGGGMIIAACGCAIITVLITRWYCIRLNKKLDAQEAQENQLRIANGQTARTKGWRYYY